MKVHHISNIIVGAGPSGIQQAYYLDKQNFGYIVLEKSAHVASFFQTFPIQRGLISINKVNCGHTNPLENMENILRYDWNSLLLMKDDYGKILFRDFSSMYYPRADDLVKYLDAFVKLFNLQIRLNTTVVKIIKNKDSFCLITTDTIYTCDRLFIGSGLQLKRLNFQVSPPSNKAFYYYDTLPKDDDVFKNRNILIIGGGNAAFEVANYVNDHCNRLTILASEKFGWNTHYPGYIRSVNMKILDSYYLKMKLTIDWVGNVNLRHDPRFLKNIHEIRTGELFNNYDIIIYCGGYEPSYTIFDETVVIDKDKYNFPTLTPFFESTSVPNLFFIGALSQGSDYKHGTSAFIHGFRYNIKLISSYISKTFESFQKIDITQCFKKAFSNLNKSSCLLHRFDFFGDFIFVYESNYTYVSNLPLSLISCEKSLSVLLGDSPPPLYVIQVYLGYDPRNKFEPSFTQPQTGNPYTRDISVFLHPIIKIFHHDGRWICRHEFHIPENGFNMFIGYQYHFSLIYNFMELIDENKNNKDIFKILECFQNLITFKYDPSKHEGETASLSHYLD